MPNATQTTKVKIKAQGAVKIAVEYYKEVTGDYNQPAVEEVELSKDNKHWLITLGIRRSSGDAISNLYGKTEIEYKVFKIDAQNGNVLSMKIREV